MKISNHDGASKVSRADCSKGILRNIYVYILCKVRPALGLIGPRTCTNIAESSNIFSGEKKSPRSQGSNPCMPKIW